MSLDDLQIVQKKIQDTKKLLNISDLAYKMQQLNEQMNAPDFWNSPENAQAITQDYQDIKKEVDRFADLEKRAADLLELSQTEDESLYA
jgi:peptide chain release factor 2